MDQSEKILDVLEEFSISADGSDEGERGETGKTRRQKGEKGLEMSVA
jgi:hypothetical protein